MPEYRTPGVYVEETSFGGHSIVGVPTSTALFIGPASAWPVENEPHELVSLNEFKEVYGEQENCLFCSVKMFFENGGHAPYIIPTTDSSTQAYEEAFQKLQQLEVISDVSIVAAPGYSALPVEDYEQVQNLLINFVEKQRHCFALLDPPQKATVQDMLAIRGKVNSCNAAIYYPWLYVEDLATKQRLALPPSGAIAGIYARVDQERGVWKAPANELIQGVCDLEIHATNEQAEALNSADINTLRFFDQWGFRVWGSRTTSSQDEWKYINVRRFISYLEHSIDLGTRWAVFEPNDETTWTKVCSLVENFLLMQWRNGALCGDTPEQAYYVNCGLETITQDDIYVEQLMCEIGVAVVRPAEFVIFRIGQKTAVHG